MNYKVNRWINPGFFFASVIVLFLFFSCKKDGETKAVITVQDTSGNRVGGATVVLWQDTAVNQVTGNQGYIRVTKTSDANGNAEFTFALEAYLNITATKGNQEAHGFVRLKEHETVSQTVHF